MVRQQRKINSEDLKSMDKLIIRGGKPLAGTVTISGAKNAALPELCAALLTAETVTLQNVPGLQDVTTMLKLIRNMGVQAERSATAPSTVILNAGALSSPEAPYELVKTMRASVLALGPLLARFGRAKVSLPGGCAIGSRPVDQHIKGLQAMGADITVEHGYMLAKLKAGQTRLKGASLTTDMVTVTGTENFLMAPRSPRVKPSSKTRRRSPRLAIWPKCSSRWARKLKATAAAASAFRASSVCTAARIRWWLTALKPAPFCAPWRLRAVMWS